jgi:hypothetical protein
MTVLLFCGHGFQTFKKEYKFRQYAACHSQVLFGLRTGRDSTACSLLQLQLYNRAY